MRAKEFGEAATRFGNHGMVTFHHRFVHGKICYAADKDYEYLHMASLAIIAAAVMHCAHQRSFPENRLCLVGRQYFYAAFALCYSTSTNLRRSASETGCL